MVYPTMPFPLRSLAKSSYSGGGFFSVRAGKFMGERNDATVNP